MFISPGNESDEHDVLVEMNTTPLIDVMLVLLVMLIITIPIQTHAVKLNMPVANETLPARPPTIERIDVDSDGKVLWNGEVLINQKALEIHLRAIMALPDQPELHLRPHKLARYEHVARVMAAVQRLGIKKFGIIGNEQFAD
jgi:biopolymer transport protein ExbD